MSNRAELDRIETERMQKLAVLQAAEEKVKQLEERRASHVEVRTAARERNLAVLDYNAVCAIAKKMRKLVHDEADESFLKRFKARVIGEIGVERTMELMRQAAQDTEI